MSDSTSVSTETDLPPRKIFLRWEIWRIGYNLILGGVVLLMAFLAGGADSNWSDFFRLCLVGAFMANLLYFAGPIVETYLRWLGFRNPWTGLMFYMAGTALSAILAAGIVVLSLTPF